MTIIGSGLGISAVLQIVRGILSDPDTTVKDVRINILANFLPNLPIISIFCHLLDRISLDE